MAVPLTQINHMHIAGIAETQYCTYNPKGRKDNCEKYTGRPLQYFPNKSATAHIIGISIDVGCDSFPTIHTRVASYADWIAKSVWPNQILREARWYEPIVEIVKFLVEYFSE